MDPLVFMTEVFPHKTEEEIRNIIEIVELENSDGTYEQKMENIFNLLNGDGILPNIEINVNQPAQEEHDNEGAVGYGQNLMNNESLTQHFNNLQRIFTDAAPEYLWNFCQRKRANFELNEAVEELTRDGYDKICYDVNAIWERLQEALPGADPSYLKKQSQKLALEDPERLEAFVSRAIENNDYPTKEEYLKQEKEKEALNSYKDQYFDLYKFLETFPDPEKEFRDPNRKNPISDENVPLEDLNFAKIFLYNSYPNLRKKHIDIVFKMKGMCLIRSCDMLDVIKKGLKTKRVVEKLPDIKNMPLLQEVAYLKHRKLIRRVIKYKDETYRNYKEQARALNLLETCLICTEEELIPEECFICQKGCVFCNDCVRKYVEVRMGDGHVKFPCCNNCDGEFGLQVLQMALPRKSFERLLLKIQSEEIRQAKLEGLETCPFCDFAAIPPENSTVFQCGNPECQKEACRLCRHESHIPKRCNEIEYDEDVRRRTFIEDMMTEALARTCHSCKRKFVKSSGCNKMVCSCGAIMCYLCNTAIGGYNHFGTGRCPLFTNDDEINLKRVRERAEQAKEELGNVNIKFDPTVGIENFFANAS